MAMSTTGYPYDGYDGTDESFEKLLESDGVTSEYDGTDESFEKLIEATEVQVPHCPFTHGEPHYPHEGCQGRAPEYPSERVLTAYPKRCTQCEGTELDGGLVPWSGERLCWECVDLHLDLMAKALQSEDGLPVTVGRGVTTPGHVQVMITSEDPLNREPCSECGGGCFQEYAGPPASDQHIPHDLACSHNTAAQAAGTARLTVGRGVTTPGHDVRFDIDITPASPGPAWEWPSQCPSGCTDADHDHLADQIAACLISWAGDDPAKIKEAEARFLAMPERGEV